VSLLTPPSVSILPEALLVRAADTPDGFAFQARDERVSWQELADGTLRAAAALARHGIGRGDRCAIVLPSSIDFLCAFLGAQMLGAVPLALRAKLPAAQLRRRIQEVGCAITVGEAPRVADPEPFPTPVLEAGALRAGPPLAARDLRLPDPEDLSHLQMTSGTTGAPRAAMLRHRNVMTSVRAAHRVLAPRSDDVFVGWIPLYHDLGLVRFVFEAIYFGVGTYLVEPSLATIPTWMETIARVGGTITAAPDFAYRLCTRLIDKDRLDLRSLRIATSGGEAVRLTTIRAFEEHFRRPGVVRPGYGLAVATLAICTLAEGDPLRVDSSGAVSCGRLFDEADVRIVDDDGRPCGVGERGRIQVRGPLVFAGYLHDPAATAEVLRDGWLDSGDDGAFDAEGYLYVRGRRRAMIKRGGASIAPREIEEIADDIPGVRRSAAIGIEPDAIALTEEVVVVVEVARQATDAERQTIRERVAERVRAALGFAPYDVVLVPPNAIPRTASGKIQYGELRQTWRGHRRQAVSLGQ
jgi:acyl-CoA synthetase (AMP-forming)/AMP-acid ligase II